VTDEKERSDDGDPDLESGWDFDDDEPLASARPTMAPPFDLATYAKEAMVPSQGGGGAQPPSGPAAPPPESGEQPAASVPALVLSLPPPPPLPGRAAARASAFPPARPAAPKPPTPSSRELDFSDANPVTMPPPANRPTRSSGPARDEVTGERATPEWGKQERTTREGLAPLSTIMTPLPPSSGAPSQRITPREMQRLEDELILSRAERAAAGPTSAQSSSDNLLSLANHRAPLLTPTRVPVVTPPAGSAAAITGKGPAADNAGGAPAVADPVVEMQERFALGDYSGALVMAESMLDENPSHAEAREYAESCRSVLQQMYTARIGPLDRVPIVEVARDQLRWLSIDHRTGFILSLVDGVSSLEMILDVSGMPPLDALRMLFELVQQRIISVRED